MRSLQKFLLALFLGVAIDLASNISIVALMFDRLRPNGCLGNSTS